MVYKPFKTSPKIKITALVLCVGVAAVSGVKLLRAFTRGGVQASVPARVKGSEKAAIHITEFIDFECPACADGARFLKKFMTEHPDAVYLELRYFPLNSHRHGLLAARYAECAARQGRFWPFHDSLIERQTNWKRLDNAGPAFEQIARDVGMDAVLLSQCLEDKSVMEIIGRDRKEGQDLGVKSTPTYYINGRIVLGIKSLERELDKSVVEAGH
jgi:protein-disulfide isomerase